MMNFPRDFKDLLRLLNAHCVRYAIVGGYAVAYHGHPRFTGDLDILAYPSRENAERLLESLGEFGFHSFGLEIEDFLEPGRVVQLGVPPLRIDLISSIDGVSNEDVFAHLVVEDSEEGPLCFIGLQQLIANKKAANRPRDLADLENL
jgi:hypothetical protein